MRNLKMFGIIAVLSFSSAMAQVQVAATTGFIGDLVKNVAGSRIKLTVIAPPNADPHSFEPKPSTLVGISGARVLFANGFFLEPFFGKVKAQLPKDAKAVLLAESQEGLIQGGEGEEKLGQARASGQRIGFDPHLWLDPNYGIRYIQQIRDILSQVDLAGKAAYQANAAKYIGEIKQADAEVQACLKGIPIERRKIVSQHQALGYFVRHYQIREVGSIADFAGQEKGPKSFAKLAKAMKEQGIKVIFAEPQFSGAEARALAEATGAKVGRIYSDAFDNQVNTYLGLIRANGKAVCESFK